MAIGYSPQLPLIYDPVDGHYKLNKTLREVVKQNIKMIVMTVPGERIMYPNFGVGARNFLFETKVESFNNLKTKILDQVGKYLPYVQLLDVNSFEIDSSRGQFQETHRMGITINYALPDAGLNDSLTITVKADS